MEPLLLVLCEFAMTEVVVLVDFQGILPQKTGTLTVVRLRILLIADLTLQLKNGNSMKQVDL